MIKKLLLLFIIIIAAFLRLNNLSSLPALNADEAAIGYNAYSLLETGHDEHGHSWPIHFQSFDDYKPGFYFYLVMPFVKFLGLTELAVRLPNALLGIATIFIVWLLTKELFPNKKWLPELSALFLAVSPWHIHFSRGGWEVNTATFFILLGLYLFIKKDKNWKWWIASCISFVCALYTYHAARIVVPLLIVGIIFFFRSRIKTNLKRVILICLLGVILLLPLAKDLAGGAVSSRASGVGLFADLGPISKANEQRGEHNNYRSLLPKLLHNRPVNYSLDFINNYFKHFSGEFLFISGDEIQRNKVPEIGQMYLLDLIFLLVGLGAIARNVKEWSIILYWLAIAPIAASFTFQSPHALRAENMIVPLVIISAYGFLTVVSLLKKIPIWFIGYGLILLLSAGYIWDVGRYLHQYYFHMVKTYDYSSQYGVKELVSEVQGKYYDYDHFVITTRYDQPYILFLFYLKYPPQKFQNSHTITSRDEFGFSTVPSFDKFEFQKIDSLEQVRQDYKNSLIVASPDEASISNGVIKTINFESGRPAFYLINNK